MRRNEEITAGVVRLVDPDGRMVGVMAKEEALERARRAGLDLVETPETRDPPVCHLKERGWEPPVPTWAKEPEQHETDGQRVLRALGLLLGRLPGDEEQACAPGARRRESDVSEDLQGHLTAALAYRSAEACAASALDEPRRPPLSKEKRAWWERQHATWSGGALGHAFRALELAYEAGFRDGRRKHDDFCAARSGSL